MSRGDPLPAFALLVAGLLLWAARPAPAQPSPPDLKAAKSLYKHNCEECHGAKGRGDGTKARSMGFHPRDFGLGTFKCRCTPSGALPSDDDLRRTIRDGLPGSPMTRHGDELSADEIDLVIAYVKTLTPRFESESAPPCIDVPERDADGPAAGEGRQLYRILGCWNCHGTEGAGDGPSAATLVDSFGDASRVPDFTHKAKLKCGARPRDVYRTLATGMSGTPMPSFVAAIGFAREDVGQMAPLERALGSEAAEAARAYLASQPGRADLAALPSAQRDALIAHRTWAIVDYVMALTGSGR